ncbi:hypothetical protein ME784_11210 [Lactobacillus delbrueckii]|uniref:GNAT family N-acetyltransferase n=1 Tax=Lactobacillus delbrueckii TaxID=1584 RepID=UPI001F2DD6C4|nr:GNAT family protein [Lactobacillus delbrueckii]GHN20606.1 hypothetical protein ME784_11210 [Lactobacillus delbrueckii]GHN22252.1 hypothetical protein ME785_08100 [Lactobacillus delbrueckii]GHN62112.1 hypothetical protein ME807_05190 [Lactobacillus delbrueckii]
MSEYVLPFQMTDNIMNLLAETSEQIGGKGIGSWAVEVSRDFAFDQLHLHRLELDVFSFNLRAEKAYLRAGFKREGVLRDAVFDRGKYADDILMAILEDDWRKLTVDS